MTDVIKIQNIYKEYRLGSIGYSTLREDLQRFYAEIRGKQIRIQLSVTTSKKIAKIEFLH